MSTYTYDYDFSYSPSMPIVEVELRNIEQSQNSLRMTAMIDSGSDGSMVPILYLRTIKARRVGQVVMRTITGARTIVDMYEVAIQIGPHLFSYTRVAADKYNEIIVLGRDILNRLEITLNGLASVTEIRE